MTLMDPVRLNKAALRRPELRLGSIARHLPALLRQGAHCSFCSLLEDLTMNPRTEINPRQCRAMNLRRRDCLQVLATLGCAVFAYPGATRAAAYPATVAAMKAARENETRVYYHYTEFGKRAHDEGYRGIAYLFQTFEVMP